MSGNSRIILFTNSYPFGNGYNWLDSEVALFQMNFKEVIISPYTYEGNKKAKAIPQYQNVKVLDPVREDDITFISLWQLRKIFTRRLFFYLREFIHEKVYTNGYWFKTWAQACLKTEMLLRSQIFTLLKAEKGTANQILYFYWGNNQTLLAPFLKKMGYKKTTVRFHGFDLYKERLGGYQPFRRPLLKSISMATAISAFAADYLKKEYPDMDIETKVFRLGVKDVGRAAKSGDGWLRIVSCSRIIRLKRIELIPRVLKKLPYKIEWTHLGDGEYKHLVEKELRELPDHIRVNMPGWLAADEIPGYYKKYPVDIFVSLSESEGIPVSIMEALAAGIPVFSTDVGGIREILNEQSSCLVEASMGEDSLTKELSDFIARYQGHEDSYRDGAYKQFLKMCIQEKWDRRLLEALLSL